MVLLMSISVASSFFPGVHDGTLSLSDVAPRFHSMPCHYEFGRC